MRFTIAGHDSFSKGWTSLVSGECVGRLGTPVIVRKHW